jgi:hypothetical protein
VRTVVWFSASRKSRSSMAVVVLVVASLKG